MITLIDMLETHKFVLPSSKKEIVLRPILTKEEKILLMSKENNEDIVNAISKVLNNCCLSNINWDDMNYSDFTYAFIQLRKISKGESIKLGLICPDKECHRNKEPLTKVLNINDIVRIKNKDVKQEKKIKMTNEIAVVLSHVKTKYIKKMLSENSLKKEDAILLNYNIIKDHIESIIKGEENFSNLSDEEKEAFLDSTKKSQFEMLFNWFLEEPKPEIYIEWQCDRCKKNNIVSEVDILNFFDIY